MIGKTAVGGTISIGGRYTTLDSRTAGFLDVRAGITLDSTWVVGLGFSALYFDRALSVLVTDGTYHLNAGYQGIYIERYFRLRDNLLASVSLLMGQGVIMYQYDNDYRKDKVWTEEVIDQTTYAVFEPGVNIQYRIGSTFWLGLTATYRNTSPVRLLGTPESLLRNGAAGLTARWDVF